MQVDSAHGASVSPAVARAEREPHCEVQSDVRLLRWRGTAPAPHVVVFLHGLGDSADVWRPVVAAWPGAPVPTLALDFPGHGGSSRLQPEDYNVPELARWTAAKLAGQRLPAVVLVGHSLGGRVALELANNPAVNVTRLVILDVSPDASDAAGPALNEHLDLLAAGAPSFSLFVARLAARLPLAERSTLASVLRAQVDATRQRGDSGARVRLDPHIKGLLGGASQSDGWSLLSTLPCPGAVVRGAFSSVLDEATARRMAQTMPTGGQHITLPGAGHALALEQPAALAQALHNLIADRPT